MAILDKTQDGTDILPPSTVLPSKFPELPDEVTKRFPAITDWQDEQRRVYLLIKQSLEATVTDLSAPITALQKDQLNISVSLGGFSASLTTETSARITADSAIVTSITTLTATVTTNLATVNASIITEVTARSTADTALASSITTLTATVATNLTTVNAAISTEISVRSTADTALASSITTLTATVATNLSTVNASIATEVTARSTADTALATSITTLTATVTTETTNRTNADNTLQTNINTVSAAVSTEITARATADTALASSITTVTASVTTETTNRIAADGTLTTSISTVSAAVTTEASARIAADGSIIAHWGVNLDINGNVAGFVHLDGTAASTTFTVAVDKFVVTNVNGTIVAMDIRSGGKIVFGADVQSDNFVAGVSGWWIGRNSGNAEFHNATIRGTLNAADIIAGTINIARLPSGVIPNVSGTVSGGSNLNLSITDPQVSAIRVIALPIISPLTNATFVGRFTNNTGTSASFSVMLYIDGVVAKTYSTPNLATGSGCDVVILYTGALTTANHDFEIWLAGFPGNHADITGVLTIQ